jgi:hypothetical protein
MGNETVDDGHGRLVVVVATDEGLLLSVGQLSLLIVAQGGQHHHHAEGNECYSYYEGCKLDTIESDLFGQQWLEVSVESLLLFFGEQSGEEGERSTTY